MVSRLSSAANFNGQNEARRCEKANLNLRNVTSHRRDQTSQRWDQTSQRSNHTSHQLDHTSQRLEYTSHRSDHASHRISVSCKSQITINIRAITLRIRRITLHIAPRPLASIGSHFTSGRLDITAVRSVLTAVGSRFTFRPYYSLRRDCNRRRIDHY
jgi:hypothetical protein